MSLNMVSTTHFCIKHTSSYKCLLIGQLLFSEINKFKGRTENGSDKARETIQEEKSETIQEEKSENSQGTISEKIDETSADGEHNTTA